MRNVKSKKKARALRELTSGDLDQIAAGLVAAGLPPPTEPVRPG